jgi:hypothetical protein
MKKIPLVLPEYILPLASTVNHDSIPHEFKYMLIIAYILKGIHIVGPQLGHILALNNNDFNLGDWKNYAMLVPH